MMTYDEAINRLAERSYDNTENWRRETTQRRATFVDIYSVPYEFKYFKHADGYYYYRAHVSISPDMEYIERYQFKLEIHCTGDIDDFEFDYGFLDDDDGNPKLVDITDYLIAQQGDIDDWVTGDGFYPMEADTEDETTDEAYAASFYNLLEVCDVLMAENKPSYKTRIVRSGMHIAQIKSTTELDSATMLLFLKYSTINR